MSQTSDHSTPSPALPGSSTAITPVGAPGAARPAGGLMPERQLADLPRDELANLAEDFGLDPTRFQDRPRLVQALHRRRQLIAAMDRQAMLDVVRWGRRPVPAGAPKEQLAKEIVRIRSMRFAGLSDSGLVVLAQLRGLAVRGDEPVPDLIRRLRKNESFFGKLNRKRRSLIAGVVARIVGEDQASDDYRFLEETGENAPAPAQQAPAPPPATAAPARASSVREEIEEAGLLGGLANRVKRTADSYLNQKLDEIEARIDRKLDEIDRRLAEWRDREIANRIRILKITLWASVIVALLSLIYAYVTQYLVPKSTPAAETPALVSPAPPKAVP